MKETQGIRSHGQGRYLKDAEHDRCERPVPTELCHLEHIKPPLVGVFQFLKCGGLELNSSPTSTDSGASTPRPGLRSSHEPHLVSIQVGKLRPKIGYPHRASTQTWVSASPLETHLGQLPLLIRLDPKAWDSGCGKTGTVGKSTQAADLGHGLQGLCRGCHG